MRAAAPAPAPAARPEARNEARRPRAPQRVACWPDRVAALPGARRSATGADARRASASIPGRTGIARSSTSTKGSTTQLLDAGRDRSTATSSRSRFGAASATSSTTSPMPGRRSTTCCRASSPPASRTPRGSATNTLVRAVRHPRRRVRDGPRPSLRGLRPDARPLRRRRRRLRGAAAPRPVHAARCRCAAARPRWPRRRCSINNGPTQIGLTVLQIINTRAEPARRDARHRRHLARQVHLHSRRVPAAAAQPGVRRRRAGNPGNARRTPQSGGGRCAPPKPDAPATPDAAPAAAPSAGASAPK